MCVALAAALPGPTPSAAAGPGRHGAWTQNPSPGVFSGGSFMYPSNYAWLLKRSYAAIKAEQPTSTQARAAENLRIAYSTFSAISFLSRAYWFNIQDVPEANLFAGQVDGGDDYALGTPKYPIFSMFQRWSRT